MALRRQVVDLVRLNGLDDADQRAGIGHVRIMQVDEPALFHVAHPLVEVEVLDASRVERGRATERAMHGVALLQKELCEVGAVLTGDSGDECHFIHNSMYYML